MNPKSVCLLKLRPSQKESNPPFCVCQWSKARGSLCWKKIVLYANLVPFNLKWVVSILLLLLLSLFDPCFDTV